MSILSFNTLLLRYCGMWYFDDWLTGWKKKIYICFTVLIFILIYIVSLSHTMILYDYISDINKLSYVSFTIVAYLLVCGKMFIMFFKRENIIELMKILKTQFFNPQNANEMIIYSESRRDIK